MQLRQGHYNHAAPPGRTGGLPRLRVADQANGTVWRSRICNRASPEWRANAHPGPRQQAVDGDTAPGVARQVDVVNTSGELLNLTVMAVDLPTQAMTSAQLLVPPNGQAHVGSESGLKLEPGSAVTLRSRGYQEVTTTVP